MQTAEGKLHLYVAIDRTSKFAFVQLVAKANRVTASAFLMALVEAVPYKIHMSSPIEPSVRHWFKDNGEGNSVHLPAALR